MDRELTPPFPFSLFLVIKSLEEEKIPHKNLMSDQTDGCAAMLGKYKGCHKILKETFPQLPDLGGCSAHDACNILKNGIKKMKPEMVELYSCIWANLEKHSMKKNRLFQGMFEELGEEYRRTPRFIEVRFRYVVLLAEYMEKNDRPLYIMYKNLAEEFKAGTKDVSETEIKILDIFLKDYIEVRLTNQFLIEVGKPFIKFIDFFESREIRVHHRHSKMMLLLSQHLSRFLKDGGIENDNVTPRELLKVDFKNSSNFLSNSEVFVGPLVKKFLKTTGFTPNSPEVKEFYRKVFVFYVESTAAMIKYFETGLLSITLKNISVLSPAAKNDNLETSKKKWSYLAKAFPNVMSEEDIEDLKLELVDYKLLPDHVPEDENLEDISVDTWFCRLGKLKRGSELMFPQLSKLGLALATFYNSSSETERDFSKHNQIFNDPKKHAMSQAKLKSRLAVMSQTTQSGKTCARCSAADLERRAEENPNRKRVQINHCHCSLMQPDPELIAKLVSGEPSKLYHRKEERRRNEEAAEKEVLEERKVDDQAVAERDLKREVRLLSKRIQDEIIKQAKEKIVKVTGKLLPGGGCPDGAGGGPAGSGGAQVLRRKVEPAKDKIAKVTGKLLPGGGGVGGRHDGAGGGPAGRGGGTGRALVHGVPHGQTQVQGGQSNHPAAGGSGVKSDTTNKPKKRKIVPVVTKKAEARMAKIARLKWLVDNE